MFLVAQQLTLQFRKMLLIAGSALLVACGTDTGDDPRPLENPEVYQNHTSVFRTRVVDIALQPQERTEIKAVMDEHQVILYSWSTEGGPVYADFHGHDPGDDSFWLRYREDEAAYSSAGSLVAPLSGEHGWYYRNDNEVPISINLRVSGYFHEIVDLGIFETPEQN